MTHQQKTIEKGKKGHKIEQISVIILQLRYFFFKRDKPRLGNACANGDCRDKPRPRDLYFASHSAMPLVCLLMPWSWNRSPSLLSH